MPNVTPQPGQSAWSAALACGMSMAAELVATAGPAVALDRIGMTVLTTLTADEMTILAEAMQQIIDLRATPDDLSTLGHVDSAPCPRPGCRICRNGETS